MRLRGIDISFVYNDEQDALGMTYAGWRKWIVVLDKAPAVIMLEGEGQCENEIDVIQVSIP